MKKTTTDDILRIMKIENNDKSHKELKKMVEMYHDIVENSPDTIVIACNGKIVFINVRGLKSLGYTRDEIIGKDVYEYIHPDDREMVIKNIEKILSGVYVPPTEYRLLDKNGGILYVETTRCKIEYEGKKAVQCIIRDISERKKRDTQIRDMEERYRNLVESSPNGILVLCEGKLVFANNRVADICGYTIGELIGKTPFDLIPPEDRERLLKNVNMILSGGSLPSPREYKILKKNGEIVEVEVTSSRILYEGKPAIQSTIRDISERNKSDNKIKEYIRELEILNKVAVDRELRMIELKKEVNKLLTEIGREKRYKITE